MEVQVPLGTVFIRAAKATAERVSELGTIYHALAHGLVFRVCNWVDAGHSGLALLLFLDLVGTSASVVMRSKTNTYQCAR